MWSPSKILKKIKSILSPSESSYPDIPHGRRGIVEFGHRQYVGGKWEEIGKLQFDFLVSQGLQPSHVCLDIACGSLRAGIHLIPFLEPKHYLGIDKESDLIQAGINEELGTELYEKKEPQFVVSDCFEFEKFSLKPDFGIAQSLFTHLPDQLIHHCFRKLRSFSKEDSVFFATFFEAEQKVENRFAPHDHKAFRYTRSQMEAFGNENGWLTTYIGDWNHPRDQVMVKYEPIP